MTAPASLQTCTVHGTTVAFDVRGVLIRGRSGSGKSALALRLMGLGARLVADDQTILTLDGATVTATCPKALQGLIEARGVGVLRAPAVPEAEVVLVVDLDQRETRRLPDRHQTTVLGQSLSLVLGQESAHFPAAIQHYVLYGRQE